MEMKNYNYEDIKVGLTDKFEVILNENLVSKFREITGDFNPLHYNEEYASKTEFKRPVVFGMLTASFLSTIAGMRIPGKNSLILSQSVDFLKPVFFNDKIFYNITVLDKKDFAKTIKLGIKINNQQNKIVAKASMIIKVI